jgi:hypothetical protein
MSNITVGLKEWEDLELRAERAEQERDEAREQLTRALHDLDIANGEIARAAGGGGDE